MEKQFPKQPVYGTCPLLKGKSFKTEEMVQQVKVLAAKIDDFCSILPMLSQEAFSQRSHAFAHCQQTEPI